MDGPLEVAKQYNLTLKSFNNNPHRHHVIGENLKRVDKNNYNVLNFFLNEFNVIDPKDRKSQIIEKLQKFFSVWPNFRIVLPLQVENFLT